jgi:hypothetical protein
MIRYEEVTGKLIALAETVISQEFPELLKVRIKFLFDLKKRVSRGRLVLGKCQKPNEMVRHFTIDEAMDSEGYQFVISVDKLAWEHMEDIDRVRLLRHELRHVEVDADDDGPVYRINPHNIEDFVEEIELNVDDPDWARKVGENVRKLYKKQS